MRARPSLLYAAAAVLSTSCAAGAELFQHEVLGISAQWIVVRENIPVSASETAACRYPRLDPAVHAGVKVHFIPLPVHATTGKLVELTFPADSIVVYSPSPDGRSCTTVAEADRTWEGILARANSLEISLTKDIPDAVLLGRPVAAKDCAVAAFKPTQCRQRYKHPLKMGTVDIALALLAVPEVSDRKTCQFVGHRFGVAVQVSGFDFGSMDSGVAPGGFATHYDCRSQEFAPLRLYEFGSTAVLLGGFRGTNIADRSEYPFVIVFPTQEQQ